MRDQVPKPLTLPVAEPQAPPPPVESKIVETPSPVAPPAFPAPPAPLPTPLQHPVHYEGSYPEADRCIDLSLPAPPRLGGGMEEKVLGFRYGGQDLQVKVRLERLALDFLRRYPQTEYAVYFASAPSVSARSSLIQGLKPLISGRSEVEAADILLRFVQLGFGYQVDQEQFGRERSLFPDETLFYPASDCEDRAILFAYLVRELLGLEVIGLDYPGHIATAVRFSSKVIEIRG